ncbi:MAG: DUF4145 domain-containing protein [Anaerolineae bacterium]|nr:DUF4145 domain-containing protein [Anaerolineae bacterium]
MKCPYCSTEVHIPRERNSSGYLSNPDQIEESGDGFGIAEGFCPACGRFVVLFLEGHYHEKGGLETYQETVIYPKYANAPYLGSEIPKSYRDDFREAYAVNGISPKASAAISRRLLQNILHEAYKIEKRNLLTEINEFAQLPNVPQHLIEAIDAVREIGNLAAHPTKNVNTGEIVEIEPHEADWLLEVLLELLDFTFVQPEKLKMRKAALKEKLDSIKNQTKQ